MKMLRIVILRLICIFICCAFAGDSYQESKPGNEKPKSEVSGNYNGVTKHRRKPSHSRTKRKLLIIIRIYEALWKKLNNLKPLFSCNEEHCISKEVKEMLLHQRAIIMPTKNNNRSKSICVS